MKTDHFCIETIGLVFSVVRFNLIPSKLKIMLSSFHLRSKALLRYIFHDFSNASDLFCFVMLPVYIKSIHVFVCLLPFKLCYISCIVCVEQNEKWQDDMVGSLGKMKKEGAIMINFKHFCGESRM